MAKYPNIRETLIQYLNLIEKLTHKRDNRGFIMEIKELLLEDENLKTVLSIQPAVIEAKIEIQLRFWRKLLEYLSSRGYEFNFYNINGDISLESSVRRYYTKKKNNRDYGVEFHISKTYTFFVGIEKKYILWVLFNGDIDTIQA